MSEQYEVIEYISKTSGCGTTLVHASLWKDDPDPTHYVVAEEGRDCFHAGTIQIMGDTDLLDNCYLSD